MSQDDLPCVQQGLIVQHKIKLMTGVVRLRTRLSVDNKLTQHSLDVSTTLNEVSCFIFI